MILCVSWVFALFLAVQVESANILVVTTFPSISHQLVFQPIWRELSLKGHNVTVITAFPLKDSSLTNLTEVDYSQNIQKKLKLISRDRFKFFMQKAGFLQIFLKDFIINKYFSLMHYSILEDPAVQQVIHGNQKFDVVVAEALYPTPQAFAAKFNCPLVGITSLGAPITTMDAIGNPSHPIYSPDHNLPIGRELCFKDRILSVLYSIYKTVSYQWIILPREDETVKKLFGADLPYLGDIERNISLLLLNRNSVFHKPIPLVPAIVELGRVRSIKTDAPLNTELKEFLDNSETDVIYFSLGSNIQSVFMSEEIIEAILETFSKLPYNIVWKWENDVLPGKPRNVFIQKWIPQIALLGHPKVKLFITQGGLQSMEETINNEVPIIGIPSVSDQYMNVDTAAKYGFGIAIDFEDLNVQILTSAIQEMMVNNAKYKEKVIRMKTLMNDLPFDGLERAVWWIEYVVRHKGAEHLRSPVLDVPWYQSLLLDVMAMLTAIFIIFAYSFYKIIQVLYCLVKKLFTKKDNVKKNK